MAGLPSAISKYQREGIEVQQAYDEPPDHCYSEGPPEFRLSQVWQLGLQI